MAGANTVNSKYVFVVEFFDKHDRVLRNRRLKPADFEHAIRHAHFDALRRGLLDAYQPLPSGARVAPLFSEDQPASPRTKGFGISIPLAAGQQHQCEFGITYFGSAANRLRAELVRTEIMSGEQQLYYRLNAFLDEQLDEQPANKLGIRWEEARQSIPLADGCRSRFGPAQPWDQPAATDLPVLVNRVVLEEAVDEARASPEREIAGFLLGRLLRDAQQRDVLLAVTGLATAGGTIESSGTSVTFTPSSFAQVRNIIQLRAAGESVIGWYHSHPFKLCGECPLPVAPECIDKVLFFSHDDLHLMETTFEQPFMVGLLAAVDTRIEAALGHLPVRLYGWRQGQIQARGFEVVDGTGGSR